jgi:twinkle protein
VDDAKRFANEQGIRTWSRNGQLHFQICPYCHGNTGKDKQTFAIDEKTGMFNCKRASCGAKGNMITLARDFGFSLGKDVDAYINPTSRYKNMRKYSRPVSKPAAVAYMESR